MRGMLRGGLGRRLATLTVVATTGAVAVTVGLVTTSGAGAADTHRGAGGEPACVPAPGRDHHPDHDFHDDFPHDWHRTGDGPYCRPSGSTTTTAAPVTTTTAPVTTTTAAPVTTTTAPATTTTVPVTTTTVAPPPTTTTTTVAPPTTPTTQPCFGVIINGICFFTQ